jgi:hypothetical protein
MITKRRLCLRVLRLAALDGEFAKLHASAALREGSSPPGLRLPKAKLSRKSNQVARGRIRRFESDMPSHAVCPWFELATWRALMPREALRRVDGRSRRSNQDY